MKRPVLTCSGFSILEMIVANVIGLLGVLAVLALMNAGVAQAMRHQAKDDLFEIRNDLQRVLAGQAGCLANLSGISFDESLIAANPNNYYTTVPVIRDGAGLAAPIIIAENAVVPKTRGQVTAGEIKLANWVKIADDDFKFTLRIPVVHQGMAIANIQVLKIRMKTTGPASAKVPTACFIGNDDQAGAPKVPTCKQVVQVLAGTATALCPNGEVWSGGGGHCLEADGTEMSGLQTLAEQDQYGYLDSSMPIVDPVTGQAGWSAHCYSRDATTQPQARAVVTCCKY